MQPRQDARRVYFVSRASAEPFPGHHEPALEALLASAGGDVRHLDSVKGVVRGRPALSQRLRALGLDLKEAVSASAIVTCADAHLMLSAYLIPGIPADEIADLVRETAGIGRNPEWETRAIGAFTVAWHLHEASSRARTPQSDTANAIWTVGDVVIRAAGDPSALEGMLKNWR